MSRALDFQIRYGNADELDNYDPMGDVYNNQAFIGGTQYLIFSKPSYDTTTRQTILNDEIGTAASGRIIVSDRCIKGDGASTLNIKDTLTGTVTAKGYVTTSGTGGWSYSDITLVSGVLTLASGTWYKGIERYLNGVLYDRIPFEDVASGSDVTSFYTTKGDTIDLTPDTISSIIPTSRTDIPWASAWGDRYGYGDDLAFDFDPNSTLLTQYADSPTKKIARIDWTTSSGVRTNYIGGHQTDGAGNLIIDPDGFSQKWVTISGKQYYNAYRDYSDPNVSTVLGNQELGISQDFLAGDIILKIDKKSGGNFTVGWQDNSVYLNFVALTTAYYGASIVSNIGNIAQLFNALNGGVDTGGACPNGADDDYPNTTLGINTGAGFSVNATATQMRSLLEQSFRSATAGNFLDALVTDGYNASTYAIWRNTLTRVYVGSIALSSGYNDITLTTTTLLATAGLGSWNNTFWQNYERIFQKYQSILFRMSTTSGAHWYRYEQLSIDEVSLIPASEDDKTVNAKNGNPLTFRGKFQFNAFRLDNKAAYFDTHSALIPASGTISGYAIDETWGSATFAMSGNAIACTASGSCNGIKLDNGNWYTFSEGIFGDASNYVYDVSGSGVHLQISGQTAADTWQQAAGQTDLGYDWRNLYGGHRYRLVDAADDIFIPHVVNTQDVPTQSLLPSGYTLLTDITSGKYVYNNSTWLLASGQVSEYRSELDAHEMNVTAFTESYGHYIRQQSNRWDRIVIYPENLSEAANTLVDFNAGDIESIVGITYKVTDIHDLNQINASYSKKFRLPATQRNNDLFDYVYDPNSSDFESLKEPKDCEIISNGIEILRGKGQVEATYKKDIATAYDMSVIGDNYNVYTALDDIMVSGLDLGTFTLSQANVEASWNYTAASGNVVFAPIDWGNKNYNSFDIADITPSLFIRNILQKGFASAGIGYESAWLDGDYAGRLVTPFNGFWTLSDADYATISGYAYFNAEDTSYGVTASGVGNKAYLEITEVTSNPNYAPATGYLAADAAKMKFTLAFDDLTYDNANIQALAAGTVGAALFGCTFGIEINGQDVIEKTIGAESLSISTSNIQIIGGDIVRVYMKGAEDVNLTNVSFKSEVKRDIAQDITITLNQYTPVYKDGLSVFDIFKGLADVFNIIAYYDPYSKLLKFEPYADFYSGELDWSDKWNQTLEAKNFYLGNQLNREILHKYKDDDTDYWLERFDKGNEEREPYASYLLELPRNYTKGRRVVENHIFAPTTDYEFSQFGVTIPNIRWNTKDGSQFSGGRSGQVPQPRILYFEGKNNSGTFKMNVGSGFQYSVQEYAYFPRLAFRARSGESWQSLAMDTYDSKNGAFRTYFEPKYRNIWSGITSIYWLNLTEKDIALRPLDKKIYLDGAWWLINQIIDFNPLNDDPTQVELIKLVNYTFNIPSNKTPWIDIVTGKKFDPVSHKPNNDLPSNGGFDVTTTSGYVISPVDDDYYGVSFGQNNLAPNKANSVMFGSDLNTYWSDQFIVGQFNSPNQNAIFQVGGGTSASGRKNAFEVEKSGGEFVAKVGGDRIVSDAWHMTTSGVKRSSYKQLTGSATLAGDGTLTIYPTHDATSSGTALFNEITFASAMVTNLNGGGGSSDLHFNTLTTTQIDIYATSAHGYDIIYKIEGN